MHTVYDELHFFAPTPRQTMRQNVYAREGELKKKKAVKSLKLNGFWYVVPGAGIEPARLAAGDFESPASTNFTTRACLAQT